MITVEEALTIVLRYACPLPSVEVNLAEALGRTLAEDVRADEDMPPFRASSVDGYAVVAADTQPERRLIGEQTAGQMSDLRVLPGTAARITTGAPVPEGADAVVMVERTEERDSYVVIHQPTVRSGEAIRPIGQDIGRGDLVLRAGQVLGPAEVGVLATVGRQRAPVIPAPVVAVLSTGDELVEPGERPGPGQIRDSNRYTLMGVVRQAGAVPLDLGIARDEEVDLRRRVARGLAEADILVSSGGVSMGHLDLVKPLLEELGTVHFGRLYMKPGKPLTFATVGSRLAFALPGNPVSSLVSFELVVRPALMQMQGRSDTARPTRRVRLAHAVRHDDDRTEYQRAIVRREGDGYWATTTGFQGSGRLMSLVGANALLVLPMGHGDFAAGDEVNALVVDDVG
ncbi:MAG: molybdopterin molybdotransferase MoeA [Anaerolineae bacterium]|nr:molybdopterin molybdotransferase MoeA [Anaerolineae bacterium]